MKGLILLLTAVLLVVPPSFADAGNHKNKSGHCPPGLAKKNPPCVPPGQAKKYSRGDYINRDYTRINRPEQYGLNRDDTYYRVGDYVYRVDKETQEVLDLIGAVDAVLN